VSNVLVFLDIRLEIFALGNTSLLGPFVNYKKGSAVNTTPGTLFTTLHFHHNLQMGEMYNSVSI
jgi:hypothetical protein